MLELEREGAVMGKSGKGMRMMGYRGEEERGGGNFRQWGEVVMGCWEMGGGDREDLLGDANSRTGEGEWKLWNRRNWGRSWCRRDLRWRGKAGEVRGKVEQGG